MLIMSGTPLVRHNIRPFLIYAFIFIILLSASGLLKHINVDNIEWYYILASTLAFGCGFIHVKLMYKIFYTGVLQNFRTGLLLTSSLVLISIILTFVLYFILKLNLNFLSFQLAFVLPFLIEQTYIFFLKIPFDEYKLWYYPLNKHIPIIDIINSSEAEVLKFVLSKNPESVTQTSFTLDIPVDIPVGQLFYNLIIKYNETNLLNPIQYVNENNETYGWLFFIRKDGSKKKHFIDPDLSFSKNNINSNEIIYAGRETDSTFMSYT